MQGMLFIPGVYTAKDYPSQETLLNRGSWVAKGLPAPFHFK